jgi:DNA-binding transcriptional MerR regulator
MVDDKTYSIDEIEKLSGFDRRTIAYYVQQGLLPKVGRRGPRTRYSQLFLDRLRFISKIRALQDQGEMGTMTLADFRDLFRSVPEETITGVVEGTAPLPNIGQEARFEAPAMASPLERRRAIARKIENLRPSVDGSAASEPLATAGMPLDPARDGSPEADAEERYLARAYQALPDEGLTAAERDTPSGEHHRLTLDALEREPGAPVPDRKPARSPATDDQLRDALARLSAVLRRQPRAYLRTTETWTRARVTEELSLSARGLSERHLPLLERVAQILRRLMREGEGGF